MTYHKLLEFLGHFKNNTLPRYLRVEDLSNSKTLTDNAYYVIKGNDALMEFVN